jgi:hypothetical protein
MVTYLQTWMEGFAVDRGEAFASECKSGFHELHIWTLVKGVLYLGCVNI